VARPTTTIPEFLAIREQNHVFEDIVGNYQLDGPLPQTEKGTRRFPSVATPPAMVFDFLGVPPIPWPCFSLPRDVKARRPRSCFMMNYRLWQTEFNGDPPKFSARLFFPERQATHTSLASCLSASNGYGFQLVVFPLGFASRRRWHFFSSEGPPNGYLGAGASQKGGVSLQAAANDLDAIIASPCASKSPGSFIHSVLGCLPRTLLDFVVGDFKSTL